MLKNHILAYRKYRCSSFWLTLALVCLSIICLLFQPGVTNAIVTNNQNNHAKDSEMPITINSNYAEFDDKEGFAIYIGNVVTEQGSRQLTAEKLILHCNANNKISLVVASGRPAKFKVKPNPTKTTTLGKAKTIKYFPEEDKALLIDDAELTQNGYIIRGQLLTYYFNADLLTSQPKQSSRTTVILQPAKDK